MSAPLPHQQEKLFISGNEAIARGAWESGCRVVSSYPGTPSSEILESAGGYEGLDASWTVNEKTAFEVAIGASLAGSRALCAMKHVGVNVAADALMTQAIIGVNGGIVLVVADDVGMSSSQNEQDSRYWGRFAHLPILEPATPQEAYEYTKLAFGLSEQFDCPVIVRVTTRLCHVKSLVTPVPDDVGQHENGQFNKAPQKWVMVPANARKRVANVQLRDIKLAEYSNHTSLNHAVQGGTDESRIAAISSGPAYLHLREAFPQLSIFKLGMSHPIPVEALRRFCADYDQILVVEETEPLIETELKAQGIDVQGKSLLPSIGELTTDVLVEKLGLLVPGDQPKSMIAAPLIETDSITNVPDRPPTFCAGCPHLGIFYCLSRLDNVIISGDVGCYSLGAGKPWDALDTCISMGASMAVALGLDKGRNEADQNKHIVAVIGDSTFLHMGMQGLLDITTQGGNITIILLDNRAVGMTGGQPTPATPQADPNTRTVIDFTSLCIALGVNKERIQEVDSYDLPAISSALRTETSENQPSVIISTQPCVLVAEDNRKRPFRVDATNCTYCTSCLKTGCPAISDQVSGNRKVATIDPMGCTGCGLCIQTCEWDAIKQ